MENKSVFSQTYGKRALASIIDFILVLILGISSMALTFPIVGAAFMNKAVDVTTILPIESGLYVDNGVGGYDTTTDQDLIKKAVYDFYVDKTNEEGRLVRGLSPILVEGHLNNTLEDFYVKILKKGSVVTIFDFTKIDGEKPYLVETLSGVSETTLANFYTKAYETALNEFLTLDYVVYYANEVEKGIVIAIVSGFVFTAIILFLILPLFSKNGLTLGFKFTKTTVSNIYGFKISKGQTLLRGLGIIFINYFGAFFLLNFVSIIFIIFDKRHQSLVDKLSATLVLNKDSSLIFKNADELILHYRRIREDEELYVKRNAKT